MARRLTWGAIALAAMIILSGCGSTAPSPGKSGSDSSPFVALFIGDLTGPTKSYGHDELLGFQASSAYLNAHGGLDGRKIKIVQLSDNGDPATAVSVLLKYLSSNPRPDEVWAGSESDEIAALLPVGARNSLFAIAPNDGPYLLADAAKFPDSFAETPTQNISGDGAAADYFKAHGIKKVGILQEQFAIGQSETPILEGDLKKLGIGFTVATFPPDATDLTPELSKLQSGASGAVFFEGFGPSIGYAMTARSKLGWPAPLVGDPASTGLDYSTLVPRQDLAGVHETVFRATALPASNPAIKAFRKWSAPFGRVELPLLPAAFGWDMQLVVAHAATQAHSTTPAALSEAMNSLQVTSDPNYLLFTSIGYSKSNHENILATTSDFNVVPAAPVVNGLITP